MNNIVNNAVKTAQNLTVWEIGLLKIYLVSATFLLSIWFPFLLSANIAFYVIIALISWIYIMMIIMSKEWNFYKKVFTKWFNIKIFKKLNLCEFTVFKISMASISLLIAKLFPVLLTAHVGWYIWITAIWAWYFSNMFFYKK